MVRALAFVNHANMGSYREAIDGYLSGKDAVPDITLYREQGRVKYGFGLNAEQELTPCGGPSGVSDGTTAPMNRSPTRKSTGPPRSGTDFRGKPWHRPQDKVGAAFVANGISGDHRRYLALGGLGFILGDGGLDYGLEKIFETYYTAHLWRGISVAFDYQHVTNPGYNQDRGPVSVYSFRVHIEDADPVRQIRERGSLELSKRKGREPPARLLRDTA